MTSGEATGQPPAIPGPVLAWGLAGLIPFAGLPLLALALPALAAWSDRALGLYAAVILSFLGGARWGQAVQSVRPDARLIALCMAPSVAAWGLSLLPDTAAALALHLLWDTRAEGLPPWYPRLRLLLTGGAVASLAAAILT